LVERREEHSPAGEKKEVGQAVMKDFFGEKGQGRAVSIGAEGSDKVEGRS